MSIATGTFTGNGTRQSITLAFEPEMVWLFPAASAHCPVKMGDFWCGRTNQFGSSDSYIDGIKLTKTGFSVGPNAKVNTNARVYHYVALARSAGLKMAFAGAQGNATAGRVMKLDEAVTPSVVFGKRDSTRGGVMQVLTSATAFLGGTALTVAGAITALSAGQFTVDGSVYVNEYDPALELGEGIDFWAFEDGANAKAAPFSGNAANRSVNVGFEPEILIIARLTGTTQAPRIKTATMGTDTAKPLSDAAGLVSSGVTLTATGFDLTAASALNANGSDYVYFAIAAHDEIALAAPAVKKSGQRAVYLPGRTTGSHIDCGTDDSLVIDGAITLECLAAIEPVGRTTPVSLQHRGSDVTAVAGTCSLALYANGFVGSPGTWPGPLVAIGCTNRIDLATSSTVIRSSWRTGLLLGYGKLYHMVATHDGVGGWNYYMQGRLVRQRAINLVTDASIPNIDGVSGHRMVLGGMQGASAIVNNLQRQRRVLDRIYNRALTAAEVASRFARAGLLSAEADVTSGLVEEWDARNASGASLPATINAGNNGTITNGSIITL